MMRRKLLSSKLPVKQWFFRFPVCHIIAITLLFASTTPVEGHAMKKIIKHVLKHGYDHGQKSYFLGVKGVLVPIPIPMKVTLPSFKSMIGFNDDGGGSGGDSGGGDDGKTKVKYVPIPVPVKGGGGKGWSGGGGGSWNAGGWLPQGGGDWNGGGGWESSLKGWKAPPAPPDHRWKGDNEEWRNDEGEKEWESGERSSWQSEKSDNDWESGGEVNEWRSMRGETNWESSDWPRNSEMDTDWDDDWR